jgi:hypothetical protein
MPWIKVIEPEDATGELKQEYDDAAKRAGRVYNILKVQSLNPGALRASMLQLHQPRCRRAGHRPRA